MSKSEKILKDIANESNHMMLYQIDLGFSIARLYTRETKSPKNVFLHFANECFGIRKSIMKREIVSTTVSEIQKPWSLLEGAAVVLQHNGDTIVWDNKGEKIKNEFD